MNQLFSTIDLARKRERRAAAQPDARFSLVHGRTTYRQLTPRQQEVLDSMKGADTLNIHGVTYTLAQILSAFTGQSIPKDPKICEFLGIPRLQADYGRLAAPRLTTMES